MTTVIGGDVALAATGLAVWRDGAVHLETIKTSIEDGDKPTRWSKIGHRIYPWAGRETLYVAEGVYHRAGFGAVSLDLAAVRGVVLWNMHLRFVPWVSLTAQQAKVLATGEGKASKAQMLHAARFRLRLAPKTHDEADAAWLMAAGLTRYPEGRDWLAERGVVPADGWDAGIDWPELPAKFPFLTTEESGDHRHEAASG